MQRSKEITKSDCEALMDKETKHQVKIQEKEAANNDNSTIK